MIKLLVKNIPNAIYDTGDVVGIFDAGADLGPYCQFSTHKEVRGLPPETDMFSAPGWDRPFVVIFVDCERSDVESLLEPQILVWDEEIPTRGKARRWQLAPPEKETPLYNQFAGDGEATAPLTLVLASKLDKGGDYGDY